MTPTLEQLKEARNWVSLNGLSIMKHIEGGSLGQLITIRAVLDQLISEHEDGIEHDLMMNKPR